MRRCFAYLTVSMWSYHQSLEVWGPNLEQWRPLLHLDANPNPAASTGITPGTWLKVTSLHRCIHVVLAQATLKDRFNATDSQQRAAASSHCQAFRVHRNAQHAAVRPWRERQESDGAGATCSHAVFVWVLSAAKLLWLLCRPHNVAVASPTVSISWHCLCERLRLSPGMIIRDKHIMHMSKQLLNTVSPVPLDGLHPPMHLVVACWITDENGQDRAG